MRGMREIEHPVPPAPRPAFPPRPKRRLVGGGPRRRLAAVALAAVLGVALVAAAAGTLIGSLRGAGSPSALPDFPFAAIGSAFSDLYARLSGVAGSGVALVTTGRDALALVPYLARGERAEELVALLGKAEGELSVLGGSELIPGIGTRAADLASGVAGLRAWLTDVPERRVAIVLGNSAEMRAGGGFIGSYADVTLRRGALSSATVRDVLEADRASADRTIPPAPLEPVADRWRAADANWFLSGPASGEAFLDLLNRSALYEASPVDAVVFVSPRFVSDLLALTGPVAVSGMAVESGNFLRAIQEEVQAGQAAGHEAPKAILQELAPAFATRLLEVSAQSPLGFIDAVAGALSRRDVVLYARDPAFQGVLERLGVTGSLYPTDAEFMGGYAAVAPSTIGGDKTDAVTSQAIRIREQLLPKGLVETSVEIERTHGGTEDDPWWYREEHRSYVKVYAPQGAEPTASFGVWQRERDEATYGEGFAEHPLLAGIVETSRAYDAVPGVDAFVETGKQVFGFWQRTAPGSGTVAGVTYARRLPRPLASGDAYAFVLERQPASSSTYQVELFAPPGLVWEETGTTRYLFESADPAGRTTLEPRLIAGS